MTSCPGIEVGTNTFTDLVYADDSALFVKSAGAAAECLSSFQQAASTFGMQISWPKTKVQNLGVDPLLPDPAIIVDGNQVERVDEFTYLGSIQSSDGYCRKDIKHRIALASSVMSSLKNIWRDQRLSLSTKTRIYQALVLSVLLYASETWTISIADMRSLEAFHFKCQRQMLRIRWQDRVRNTEISDRTGLPTVGDLISKRRHAIFSHVARLSTTAPANQALKLQVDLSLNRLPSADWKRRPGRPRSRWVDQLRQENHSPADLWRSAIRRGHSGATLRSSLTTR